MSMDITNRTELKFPEYAHNIFTILEKDNHDITDIKRMVEDYYKDSFYAAPETLNNVSYKFKTRLFAHITSLQDGFTKNIDRELAEFFNKYT